MSKFDQLVEDYATSPVPEGQGVSGFRIALIVIGIGIALPGFVEGAQVGKAIGLVRAAAAFALGGAVLAIFASLTSVVAAHARLTTYVLVQYSFGPVGARFVNFVLAATMFGWFGVNAALFGQAVLEAVRVLSDFTGSPDVFIVIGSMLMILTTIFGFKALDKLSLLAVPVLIFILVYVVSLAVIEGGPRLLAAPDTLGLSMGWAVSAVIGGNIVMAATMPDIARFASSPRQAVIGAAIAFALASPVVLLAAAVPSLATGEADLVKIIMGLGFGVSALLVVIFSTWTSNGANLYCSGLSFAAIFPSFRRWQLTVAAGILGTVVALSGVIEHFIPFLLLLGISVPPVAVIYVADFYRLYRRRGYDSALMAEGFAIRWSAFAAWAGGSLVAAATATGRFHLTTVPAFDAVLVTILLYLVLVIAVPYWRALRLKEA